MKWWFRKQKCRPPENVHVPIMNFIGEQDGSPELELKEELIILFRSQDSIMSAYLARVDYGNPRELNVALCIRQDAPDESVKVEAGKIFTKRFGSHAHLDIIFILKDQEESLRKVCRAFYQKDNANK